MIDSLAAAYRTLYGWLIADRDDVLVVSHVRPDGDALGAQTAMHRIIQKLGRRSAMVNADHPPKRFDYLPGYAEIHTVEALMSRGPYRRAVFVDCADRARIGDVEALLSSDARIANIDHHATNDRYGEINVVRAEASSTCEIVYDFVRAVGVAMDEALATALYTGLLTDTGGFRYQNTSPKVLHDAAELVECGAEPYSIAEQALETMSLPQLRLLARVLGDIQLYAGGRVALIEVTAEALREAGAELDDTEGLVHYARNIEGVEVAVLLREQDEGIKASFRSRRRVDVAALAQKFGGGGHVRAAGATLAPPMAEARARVLEVLRATLSNPEEGKR
ncbi:MAG: bifunctional oligoribonuclease/PAP phosphatase NrnA [Hydrogenibacillus sp.]|nr:bifunctional oligoribonuclease/PAP phosphatase NrnA [Hydrogenibacillus sp.]